MEAAKDFLKWMLELDEENYMFNLTQILSVQGMKTAFEMYTNPNYDIKSLPIMLLMEYIEHVVLAGVHAKTYKLFSDRGRILTNTDYLKNKRSGSSQTNWFLYEPKYGVNEYYKDVAYNRDKYKHLKKEFDVYKKRYSRTRR